MANYSTLKSAIQDVIKTNGNEEITGALLQQSLLAMITSLGEGYNFVGVATPQTNPGTPDQNVFYIASISGTYSNFGGIILGENEISILKYNGTWTKDVFGAATKSVVDNLVSVIGEIGKIVSDYLTDKLQFDKSGFIDTTGAIVESENYANTGLIPVLKYSKLYYKTIIGGGEPSVTFYDSRKQLIPSLSIIESDGNLVELDLTAQQYVNVSFVALSHRIPSMPIGYFAELIAKYDVAEILENIATVINGVGISGRFIQSGFYDDAGNFQDSSNARNTGLLPIPDGYTTLKYKTRIGTAGLEVAFFNAGKSYIGGIQGTGEIADRTLNLLNYPNAKYIAVSVYGSDFFQSAQALCFAPQTIVDYVINELSGIDGINNQIQILKDCISYLNPDYYVFDGYINSSGQEGPNIEYKRTGYLEYLGGNILIYNSQNGQSSCVIAFYNSNKEFISGIVGSSDFVNSDYFVSVDDVPQGTKYIRCSTYKHNLGTVLFVNTEQDQGGVIPSSSDKLKLLVFGDSISDCAAITINSNNQTTSYQLMHPGNSYYDGQGHLIEYDMWPYILQQYFGVFDLRNYAVAGASYKNEIRQPGEERQNLSYQIQVAENDLPNPQNVFPTQGMFIPDIVIFALGVNDGTPNDTFTDAMEKTIMNVSGTAVNIPATLANLDLSKFNEAVRYAFLKIKHLFPYALVMCVLPIQRASQNEPNMTTLHDALIKMAEYHSIIVVDGAFTSGIILDNETVGGLGQCLKDGLHPNDKGQNLMARMIINAVKNNYVSNSFMNP